MLVPLLLRMKRSLTVFWTGVLCRGDFLRLRCLTSELFGHAVAPLFLATVTVLATAVTV